MALSSRIHAHRRYALHSFRERIQRRPSTANTRACGVGNNHDVHILRKPTLSVA